jgi:hypothetical protein
MDLDDMKETWMALNSKLDNQQIINEKLIKKITNEQSSNRLNKILRFEIGGHLLNWLFVLYLIPRYGMLDSVFLKISYFGIIILAISTTYLSYVLYKKMAEVNIQKHTLVARLGAMASFKKYYYQYKKMGVGLSFLALIFVIPIVVKLVHHKDILDYLSYFLVPTLVGLVLGFGLLYIIYKQVYEKNIEEVELLLNDLEDID